MTIDFRSIESSGSSAWGFAVGERSWGVERVKESGANREARVRSRSLRRLAEFIGQVAAAAPRRAALTSSKCPRPPRLAPPRAATRTVAVGVLDRELAKGIRALTGSVSGPRGGCLSKISVTDMAGEFGVSADEVMSMLRQMDVAVRGSLQSVDGRSGCPRSCALGTREAFARDEAGRAGDRDEEASRSSRQDGQGTRRAAATTAARSRSRSGSPAPQGRRRSGSGPPSGRPPMKSPPREAAREAQEAAEAADRRPAGSGTRCGNCRRA